MLPRHPPARFKKAAKTATTSIVSSFPIRPSSSNNPFPTFSRAAEKCRKFPPLQFLEKFFQKDVTFLLYQVSIVVYVDFLHHPTFPREATRGDFFLGPAGMIASHGRPGRHGRELVGRTGQADDRCVPRRSRASMAGDRRTL